MQAIPHNPRYVCRRCLQHLSRQHSTLLTHSQLRPQSTGTAHNGSSDEPGLRITKHWNTDFRGKFRMTWASRSALHVSENGEKKEVALTETRPLGRIRGEGFRRRDGVVRVHPRLPGGGMRRPLRRERYARAREQPEELVPSPPSAPLGTRPKPTPQPPPPPIYAPETPMQNRRTNPSDLDDVNWYWETLPPTIAQKTQASHFFTTNGKNAKLLRSVAHFRLMPESDVPEIAFVGRSNVGKSSLLNAVVNADIRALLARTSVTPGFTKTMNLYGLGPGNGVVLKTMPNRNDRIVGTGGLTIVDMPGYGSGSLAAWGVEIMKYIQSRRQLRRVFVLLDAQHGIKDKDRALLASLRLAGVSHQVILSKIDKLYVPKMEVKRYNGTALSKPKSKGSPQAVRKEMEKLRKEIQPPVGGGALGELLAVSAETMGGGRRLGVEAVRCAIWRAAGLQGGVRRVGSVTGREGDVKEE